MAQPHNQGTLGSNPSEKKKLEEILAEKSWIGFDLDDTLHEFRSASSTATNKTLVAISVQYGTPVGDLKAEYSKILRQKTAGAFADGKTSHEYREERFRALSDHFSLGMSGIFIAQLLEFYETTLMEFLQLKDGVLELFATIHAQGKKIAVITEGPQDAQERTIKRLRIAEHIDFLATTNFFGVSKVDGLFPKVLGHLNIAPSDIAYVGDSKERDMRPAHGTGICCIQFSPNEEAMLESETPRINKMNLLNNLLLSHP